MLAWISNRRVHSVILSSSDANVAVNGDKILVNKKQWELILMDREMYSHRLCMIVYEWGKAFRSCNATLKDITFFPSF